MKKFREWFKKNYGKFHIEFCDFSKLIFRKSKKKLFFTVFWVDLEGAGWFSPPHSCNIQKPRPINRVNNEFSVYLSLLSYQLIFYPGVQHPKAESNCMTVSNMIDFWSGLRIKNIPITSFGFFWKFRIKL